MDRTEANNNDATAEIRETVMNNKDIQKSIEEATGKVANTTKIDGDRSSETDARECQNTRRSGSKVHKSDKKKGAQKKSKESQSRSSGEMQYDAWTEENEKKAVV